jgi:hypothetical protein
MTKDQVYKIWRPADSPWSPWVKAVLFSYMAEHQLPPPGTLQRKWEVPRSTNTTAIIVDIPGETGVTLGLALCQSGYRPIPVYNACPYATYERFAEEVSSILNPRTEVAPALVEVAPIMSALGRFAQELEAAQLPPTASPAFLIDGNRHGGRSVSSDSGWFDNRSFITSADFPSSKFLKEHGVSRIVVIQMNRRFRTDLQQVLLTWQAEGLVIAEQEAWERWDPKNVRVKTPSVVLLLWHRLTAKFGYSRNLSGSFGQLVPPTHG